MILTKVNHIGYSYFHKFLMDDGSWVEIETTKEDYAQLGTANPNNPTIAGGKWQHSYECLKFDTPDGRIRDGEYADIEGRYQYVKLPLKRECSVPLGSVKLDELTDTKVLERIDKNNLL